jgi:hypothetical protein
MNAEEVNETGPDTVNENTLASDCLMSGTRFGWRQLLVDSEHGPVPPGFISLLENLALLH